MGLRPTGLAPSCAPSEIVGFQPYRGSITRLSLRTEDVHVWSACLDVDPSSVPVLEQALNDEERGRAQRFHRDGDRADFIVAHYVLRSILGRYREIGPEHLRFRYGPHGKPYLVQEEGRPAVCFNLSHSNRMMLCAMTREREIGIDIEHVRPKSASLEVAERFFAPGEVAALRALPDERFSVAFFACWTRKEAYIKARGEGLSHPLDTFEVSVEPGLKNVGLQTYDDPHEASRWSLQDLSPMAGYVGAIAVQGRGHDISYWQWPTSEYRQVKPSA